MEPRTNRITPTGAPAVGGSAPAGPGDFLASRPTGAGGAGAEELRKAILSWLEEEQPEPTLTFKPAWWRHGEAIYENIYADGQYLGIKRFKNGAVYVLVVNKISGTTLYRVPDDILDKTRGTSER